MLKPKKTRTSRLAKERPMRTPDVRYSREILAATEELIRRIDVERSDPARMNERLIDLEESVRAFELRYGLKSEEVHAAIEAGTLRETYDVSRWLIEYEVLKETSRSENGRSARLEL